MAKLVTHLLLSIPLTPSGAAGPLVRGYCRRLVPERLAVSPGHGEATCKRCLERIATANAWTEAFRAELRSPARAVMSDGDRRHDAWNAVVDQRGNHPLGHPMPRPDTVLPGKPARAITHRVSSATVARSETTETTS